MEYPLTKEFVQRVAEFLNDLDPNCCAEFREDYSGRGMYGRKTPAIVTETSTSSLGTAIILAATSLYFDAWVRVNDMDDNLGAYEVGEFIIDFHDNFKGLGRSDSMGLGMVYY